ATGLGSGVARPGAREGGHRYGLAHKVVILLLADLLLAWRHGRFLGLDFLGFIAIATLVLEPLRSLRRGGLVALAGGALVLGVRFVAGPLVLRELPETAGAVAGTLAGARGVAGLAY